MKKIKITLFLSIISFGIIAQNSINSSGGDASGNGGNVAFSVGQVMFSSDSNSSGAICQGVQKPIEITELYSNETFKDVALSVFPNPTIEKVTIKVTHFDTSTLFFQFTDSKGNVLRRSQISSAQTRIETAGLSPSVYFLSITNQKNEKVKSFKIVKQ